MRTRTALLLSGCLLALPALAQTSSTISNLPSASTPLSGTEVFPVVQSGATKKVSASNLLPLSGVTAGTYGDSTHCASFTVGANGLITSASQDTSCPGSAGVTSVFGRTGDVVATSGDYAFSQLSSIPTTVSGYGITDAVTLTGSQTLTNKTLTAPVISTITNTGTITLPTSTDTLVGRNTTDTLTNKTLTAPTMTAPVLGTIASGNGAALTNLNPANLSTFVSTAKGGLGADNSAASGVPLFTSGTNAMTATTGTGNVVRATSPTLVTPALGTPASGNASNLTNIPVAQATGVLPAANGGAGTVSGILKANGSGTVSAATSGTDYAPAGTGAYITGDTTITAADWAAFKIIVVNAASKTITLPAASTLQANGGGLIIVTKNAVTLAIDSSDAINGGTTGASLALSANQNIVVATDGVHAITALNGSGGVSSADGSFNQQIIANYWYWALPGVSTANGSALATSVIYVRPFYAGSSYTIGAVGAYLVTASAGGNCAFAIYASSPTTARATGTVLGSSSSVSTTTAGAIHGTLSVVVTKGNWYWDAIICDNSTVTFTTNSGTMGGTDTWLAGTTSEGALNGNATNHFTQYQINGSTYPTFTSSPTVAEAGQTAVRTPLFYHQIASVP